MNPIDAIAERERPPKFRRAAGIFCYESFTLKALSIGSSPPIFPGVMTEAFTNISRGAGAAVRALRGNHRPREFSAHNVLRLSADFRLLSSEI
jgi:hypothetical protein